MIKRDIFADSHSTMRLLVRHPDHKDVSAFCAYCGSLRALSSEKLVYFVVGLILWRPFNLASAAWMKLKHTDTLSPSEQCGLRTRWTFQAYQPKGDF